MDDIHADIPPQADSCFEMRILQIELHSPSETRIAIAIGGDQRKGGQTHVARVVFRHMARRRARDAKTMRALSFGAHIRRATQCPTHFAWMSPPSGNTSSPSQASSATYGTPHTYRNVHN